MKLPTLCLCIVFISNIFLPTYAGNSTSNIIIIADVHGDMNRFKYILRDAGVLDKHEKWIAKPNTTVVQLGDQIDPKTVDTDDISKKHHFNMVYFTDYLEYNARKYNCTFISMIGNHEHMNINKIRKKPILANIIANRPVIHQFNNYIFCHASLKMTHHSLMTEYNITFKEVNNLWYKYVLNKPLSYIEQYLLDMLILDVDSILYTKTPDTKINISTMLDAYDADYMVVGHLISKYVHMKNRIWYLDQLLKNAFDDNVYSYLTIDDDDFNIKPLQKYCQQNEKMTIVKYVEYYQDGW